MLHLLFIPMLLLATSSQNPEQPGPHLVGWQDVQFVDQNFNQGTVRAKIYYPATTSGNGAAADPSSGPYPLVNFMHGWLMRAKDYDNLCIHLASHGFVIASTDTQSGFFANTQTYAKDSRSLLHWVEDSAGDPIGWLAGMVDGGDWAAVGHSMGGGPRSVLIGLEPRVRTIIGLQAADMDPPGPGSVKAFTGGCVWIARSHDQVVPPGTGRQWYQRALGNSGRNFYFEVVGMGHMGCTDSIPNNEPMSAAEQMRVHKRLVTSVLRAEQCNDDPMYEWLVGGGVSWGQPWVRLNRCFEPILWGGETPTARGIEVGVIAVAGATATCAWSAALGVTGTPFGNAGIDLGQGGIVGRFPLGGDGIVSWSQYLDPSFSGQLLYFQSAAHKVVGGQLRGALSGVLVVQVP